MLAFILPLALAACGTLPEPFYGNPGPEGARLAVPPAPVLMVPTPGAALLGDSAAKLYAQDLATALVDYDVPSIAGPVAPASWAIGMTAALTGNNVVPRYVITGPDGKDYGSQNGAPVPAAAWAQGDAGTLSQEATSDAATLSKLLAAINARVQGSNPNSLENRPPRLFIGAVTGAPGDGDTSLPLNLGRDFTGNLVLVSAPAQADFIVTGHVTATPGPGGQMNVDLDWSVLDSNQRKIGQVTQLHALATTDIIPNWGDVAAAAATEAAGGIAQVVENAVLHKTN